MMSAFRKVRDHAPGLVFREIFGENHHPEGVYGSFVAALKAKMARDSADPTVTVIRIDHDYVEDILKELGATPPRMAATFLLDKNKKTISIKKEEDGTVITKEVYTRPTRDSSRNDLSIRVANKVCVSLFDHHQEGGGCI